ncbi:MAG TPA: glycosyltransferase [Acidimicrobiales bacterium]
MAERISACIVCRDEADKLERCLATTGWVDEVVVLDLESGDGSGEVAARHGAAVHRRPPVPIVELVRNEVAALASSDWILVLDPDERLAPGLEAALREAAADDGCDAVVIPRTNFDLGHPPSHPSQRYEPQLRMYRRSRVAWPTVPNALPSVPEERVRRLPDRDDLVILHDRSRNIVEVLDRSIRYAPAQAQSMLDRGEVFSAKAMAAALWRETDAKLLGPRAWRDGLPGLLRAGILVGFKFHVWVELWQRSGGARTAEDDRFVARLGRGLEAVRAGTVVARRLTGAAGAVRRRGRAG